MKLTAFGCRLPGETSIVAILCSECTHYATHGSQSPWRINWPWVILDCFRGKYNGIADGKLHQLRKLKQDLTIERVQNAHNKYCFPEVRFPFGCTEFVGDTGLIPVQYFLQMLDQNFAFNKTNWKRRLRCVRPDSLSPYNHNDVFNV